MIQQAWIRPTFQVSPNREYRYFRNLTRKNPSTNDITFHDKIHVCDHTRIISYLHTRNILQNRIVPKRYDCLYIAHNRQRIRFCCFDSVESIDTDRDCVQLVRSRS